MGAIEFISELFETSVRLFSKALYAGRNALIGKLFAYRRGGYQPL
jgi:hypothetical protein